MTYDLVANLKYLKLKIDEIYEKLSETLNLFSKNVLNLIKFEGWEIYFSLKILVKNLNFDFHDQIGLHLFTRYFQLSTVNLEQVSKSHHINT